MKPTHCLLTIEDCPFQIIPIINAEKVVRELQAEIDKWDVKRLDGAPPLIGTQRIETINGRRIFE